MTPTVLAGLLALAAGPPGGVDLLFPADGGPARLRVEVTVDGRPPDDRWERFLGKLFDHFDRDGNGTLSEAEAKRVIPLPLPGGKSVAAGVGTRAEFVASYRKAGFTPVVVVPKPPTPEDRRLADAMSRQLDGDGSRLLRRLDENEDEALTPAEVLAAAPAAKLPPLPPTWPEPATGDRPADAVLRLRIAEEGGAELVPADGTRFRRRSAGRLTVPGGEGVAEVSTADPAAGVQEAREFFLAQFQSAVDDRPAVEKPALEKDPTHRGLVALFDPADRNDDGKLTAAELTAILDLVAEGVGCQVVVTVEDRGRNLFDRLDGNGDRRLDRWELREGGQLADGVPRVVRITASRGPVGSIFGPVPVAAPKPAAATPPKPVQAGPEWFQAMDRNRDGFVSEAEFVGPPARFHKLDANGDGRLDPAEAEK